MRTAIDMLLLGAAILNVIAASIVLGALIAEWRRFG